MHSNRSYYFWFRKAGSCFSNLSTPFTLVSSRHARIGRGISRLLSPHFNVRKYIDLEYNRQSPQISSTSQKLAIKSCKCPFFGSLFEPFTSNRDVLSFKTALRSMVTHITQTDITQTHILFGDSPTQ